MKVKWLAFAIASILAIATVFLIPRLQRKIPDVPQNIIHTSVVNVRECINCHIISGKIQLPQDHAARDQCLYCHKIVKG